MKHTALSIWVTAIMLAHRLPVHAGYNIESHGTTSGSIFTRLVDFMQDVVDFMDGPWAIGLIIVGVVVAGTLWVFAPDNRHLGKALKAVAVGFVLFDVGLLISYLRA